MSKRLIIRPEAEADIANAAIWYENREQGLGDQVIEEVRAAIDRAIAAPESYARFRETPQVHRILSRRFPYRIFYVVEPDALIVFAVLHGARHERHWLRRIQSSWST
jgi:plasmid stabilization system protein ParE